MGRVSVGRASAPDGGGKTVGGKTAVSNKVGKPFCLLLLCAGVAGSGCAAKPHTTVAQLEPYAGSRPGEIGKLPKRVARQPPRVATGKAAGGWIPAGGLSNRWKYIVIHHSASRTSTPQGMRQWHMQGRGWDELGYHFVIGNGVRYGDGKVFVGNRWAQQKHGAHTKTPSNDYNQHGIGICLIGDFETGRPTEKQLQSLARLVSFLSAKCGIGRSRILTHGGVTHKTACPGSHFSLDALFRRMPGSTISASSR